MDFSDVYIFNRKGKKRTEISKLEGEILHFLTFVSLFKFFCLLSIDLVQTVLAKGYRLSLKERPVGGAQVTRMKYQSLRSTTEPKERRCFTTDMLLATGRSEH